MRESVKKKEAPTPKAEEAPPWEEPPLPDEPPMPDEPGVRVFDVPDEPEPVREAPPPPPKRETVQTASGPAPSAAPVNGNWWRVLAEGCKGRLPPMYRVFLDMCAGALEGDQLTVYAPDDITLGRLDNDRVRGVLGEEAAKAAGMPVRLGFRVGEPPKASTQENLQNLLKFGSQFDNIEIK